MITLSNEGLDLQEITTNKGFYFNSCMADEMIERKLDSMGNNKINKLRIFLIIN